MKRLGTRLERWLSGSFPSAYYHWVQRPRIHFRFATERKLAAGEPLSSSQRRSLIFFTTQKCASRYVSGVIATLAQAAGMMHADYDAYVSMVRMPKERNPFMAEGALAVAFKPRGFYYGPIGTFRHIPGLEQYALVLQLRDPRDMLTSLYYSTKYSHAIINPKVIRRRKEAYTLSIDEFVLKGADEYLPIYEEYCQQLLSQPAMLLLKYEDMVADFPDWLARLSVHVGLADQEETLERIKRQADFSIEREDKFSHRRQISPGDHKRKLQPDTVQRLTTLFKPSLDQLDYPA
ncbi:MAG: sulfotransferase domain-containing protein [Anaerolineales bacterium]